MEKSFYWFRFVTLTAVTFFALLGVVGCNNQEEAQQQLQEHLLFFELAGINYHEAIMEYQKVVIQDIDFGHEDEPGLNAEYAHLARDVSQHETELFHVLYESPGLIYSNLPQQLLSPVYLLPLRAPEYFPSAIHSEMSMKIAIAKGRLEDAWKYWQPAKQKFDSLYEAAGYLDN